jgi:hypothetical protein
MYTAKCLIVNLNLSSKDWQRRRREFGAEGIEVRNRTCRICSSQFKGISSSDGYFFNVYKNCSCANGFFKFLACLAKEKNKYEVSAFFF